MPETLVKDPLYFQVNERLRAMIRRGEFAAGERFLTERQVSERFGISRATANKALSSLVAEGTVEFRKGVGTFVRDGQRLDYDLRRLVSFTQKALAAGKRPETRVLRFDTQAADQRVAAALGLSAGEPVYAMDRLRLADSQPVILERRFLVAQLCPNLTPEQAAGSLYALLVDHYRLDVAGADEVIQAVPVVGEDAALLGVADGAAALRVVSTAFLAGDVPLWHERTLYRGDAYEFHNRLGPIAYDPRAARAAIGVLK